MTDNRAPRPRWCRGWAWSNWGILVGVEPTRRDAIAAVEKHLGLPWREAKHYMEVWACDVVPRKKP